MIRKIVFATKNEGKMQEIRMILKDLNCEILSLKEVGIEINILEDGKTFEENAMIKAEEIAKIVNCVVLADDSGLEIDYLNKEPGIYSARYMGENTSYRIKNAEIIRRLESVSDEKRTARFVCAIAGVLPDGQRLGTRAILEGRIGYQESGQNGFGYDPIFYLPQYECTTAELTMEQKNKESHRGKALIKMKEELRKCGF